MRPTARAFDAMRLGMVMHKLGFRAHHDEWPALRTELRDGFAALGIDRVVPDTLDGWLAASDELEGAVLAHLTDLRTRIGGDCYAIVLYSLAWLGMRLPLLTAFGDAGDGTRDALIGAFRAHLGELSIDADDERLDAFLATESAWLVERAAAHDGEIPAGDGLRAGGRLLLRVLSLWQLAEDVTVDVPVDFTRAPLQSVFISYASADEPFAAALHEGLVQSGVRAWFAPHDMRPGAKIHEQLRAAIEAHDRLLLVLSDASMRSEWVNTELWRARQRERATGRRLLFPVRLVPWERVQAWEAFDADSGRDLAREVREYYVPDFGDWRDEARFEEQLRRLVSALAAEATPGDTPPVGDGAAAGR